MRVWGLSGNEKCSHKGCMQDESGAAAVRALLGTAVLETILTTGVILILRRE